MTAQIAQIGNLVVGTSWRRRGIGRQLMERAEDVCRDWGLACVGVAVAPDNAVAITLYQVGAFFPLPLLPPPHRFVLPCHLCLLGLASNHPSDFTSFFPPATIAPRMASTIWKSVAMMVTFLRQGKFFS
jgi:hypothetical protein